MGGLLLFLTWQRFVSLTRAEDEREPVIKLRSVAVVLCFYLLRAVMLMETIPPAPSLCLTPLMHHQFGSQTETGK